ncbi:glycosyltransferase family 4 protein [Fibrobacterota bacterium]
MPENIGLNLTSVPAQKAGVGFLILNLSEQLIKLFPRKKFFLYTSQDKSFPELDRANCQQHHIAPNRHALRTLWEQVFFPRVLSTHNIDVLINPHYVSILLADNRMRQLTVVPDLTYQRFPFQRALSKSLYFSIFIPFSLRKSSTILAISEFTKKEILEYYPFVAPEKIRVMHLGLGNRFAPDTEERGGAEAIMQRFSLSPKKYFISVGIIEPTKNHVRNLKAFVQVRRKHPDLKYLFTGRKGWSGRGRKEYQELRAIVRRHALEKHVVFTDYLDPESLSVLFSNALGLLYTSLNEGFGIPILEAMSLSVPVITSNISSMPEVAGDAAMITDPYSVPDIADCMNRLVTDREQVSALIGKGRERLALFSWEKSAEAIKDLLQ